MTFIIQSHVELSAFERDAMNKLLTGDHPGLAVLRKQLEVAKTSREQTGVGFYVQFVVPESATSIEDDPDFLFGDVHAFINGAITVALLLWGKKGRLSVLEGVTYGDLWPDRIETYSISFDRFADEAMVPGLGYEISRYRPR